VALSTNGGADPAIERVGHIDIRLQNGPHLDATDRA
jgi:hypothetical protein